MWQEAAAISNPFPVQCTGKVMYTSFTCMKIIAFYNRVPLLW